MHLPVNKCVVKLRFVDHDAISYTTYEVQTDVYWYMDISSLWYIKCLDVTMWAINKLKKKLCFKDVGIWLINFHILVWLGYMKMLGRAGVNPKTPN